MVAFRVANCDLGCFRRQGREGPFRQAGRLTDQTGKEETKRVADKIKLNMGRICLLLTSSQSNFFSLPMTTTKNGESISRSVGSEREKEREREREIERWEEG
jgi:hypothetical protein